MMGFRVLLGKELREQIRTNRLPVVAIVFLLFGITAPVIARYTPDLIKALGQSQTAGLEITVTRPAIPADAVRQLLSYLSEFGILIAVLLAMGSVASEKDRGTAGLILTKPASRGAFLLAKMVAIGFTLAVAIAVASAMAYLYIYLLFDNAALPVGGYVEMAALLWLSVAAYASLTFLGSTLTRSAMAGAGFGFVAFMISLIVSIIPNVGKYMPLGLSVPGLDVAIGNPLKGDLAGPVISALLFLTVPILLAWLSFRHQEL